MAINLIGINPENKLCKFQINNNKKKYTTTNHCQNIDPNESKKCDTLTEIFVSITSDTAGQPIYHKLEKGKKIYILQRNSLSDWKYI